MSDQRNVKPNVNAAENEEVSHELPEGAIRAVDWAGAKPAAVSNKPATGGTNGGTGGVGGGGGDGRGGGF